MSRIESKDLSVSYSKISKFIEEHIPKECYGNYRNLRKCSGCNWFRDCKIETSRNKRRTR